MLKIFEAFVGIGSVRIALDNLLGLTFPTHMLCGYNEEFSKDVINIILNDIDDILKKFDRDIPIYDITTELNLKDK